MLACQTRAQKSLLSSFKELKARSGPAPFVATYCLAFSALPFVTALFTVGAVFLSLCALLVCFFAVKRMCEVETKEEASQRSRSAEAQSSVYKFRRNSF